ncbi:MAG: hypothetical protein UU63_C0027G0001 [Candidatus Uhrbacteria bacterium GW2011_GWF2_41_430]|nr:MAG: hypothetical protein UU63_C0027G0001 [Candidatus Uhrbacteria bacterium GW2011_GWF2_41_430]
MGEEKIVRMEMINGFIAKKEAGAVHIVWTAPEARGQFYPAGCSDSSKGSSPPGLEDGLLQREPRGRPAVAVRAGNITRVEPEIAVEEDE